MLFKGFTILAVAALAITIFLSSTARHQQTQTDANQADLPGYYLKNAVLTDYALSGDPSVRIVAERIDQIDHGNEVALLKVQVDYLAPNGQAWMLLGDTAHIQPGGTVVDVSGDVRLQGESTNRAGAAVIHSDTLSYNVPDAIVSTKSDVRIDFSGHTLTARGLVANLKERTVHLESKVNGRFQP